MKLEFAVLAMLHALLITLLCSLVTIPLANSTETAQLARQQYIDLSELIDKKGLVAANSDMTAMYALDLKEAAGPTKLFDLQIFRRVSLYASTGYVPDNSDGGGGPQACEFPFASSPSRSRTHLTISPNEKWAAVVFTSGPVYAQAWDEATIHGYVIDLEEPNRECNLTKFMEVPAGVHGFAAFSQDSQHLYVNLPYAAWPPAEPIWGRTAGAVRHYQISDQDLWTLTGVIEESFNSFPTQNAGFATSFVMSDDRSVKAAFSAAARIKGSEAAEDRQSLLGYIPEAASRNPNLPGVFVRSGLSSQFFPFPLANAALLHQYETYSEARIGRRIGISGDGMTVVAGYLDPTAILSGLPFNQMTTIEYQGGTWAADTRTLNLKPCIAPEALYEAPITDLVLSSDGRRLIVLATDTVGNASSYGICAFSRDGSEWRPLNQLSQNVSEQLNELNLAYTTTDKITANNDLSRVAVQWTTKLLQFDIEWQEEEDKATGLPIWLLYEASRSDN